MPDNNQVLLDAIITQKKADQANSYSDADYFELFTSENILKQEALSYEELENGLVGAGGDGGLDAVYFFNRRKNYSRRYRSKRFQKATKI